MIEIAALIACVLLAGLTIFQLLLIAGLPLGKFAWGGSHEVLPTNLRMASCLSVLLYAFFSVVILDKAGLVSIISNHLTDTLMWILTAYFFLGIFMNGISRSKHERLLMTPVALVLALLFLYVSYY